MGLCVSKDEGYLTNLKLERLRGQVEGSNNQENIETLLEHKSIRKRFNLLFSKIKQLSTRVLAPRARY